MSGISGYFSFAGHCEEIIPPSRVEGLCKTLSHRGNTPPSCFQDAQLLVISNYFAVAGGDLGNGLCVDDESGLCCGLAGRIYNQAALAARLTGMGHAFRRHTQEEVVLRAFQQWGPLEFASRLEGQFGGIIWDARAGKLWLFRDRIGQRDLFYTITPEGVAFASELKGILPYLSEKPKLHPSALANVLSTQFIYEPLTSYQGIYKLKKASTLWIDQDGQTGCTVYWDLHAAFQEGYASPITNFETARRTLRQTVFDAAEQLLLPGEEVGSFLSGGLDSTIVSGVLAHITGKPIHTFSIGFHRKGFDESAKSLTAAKAMNSEHHAMTLGYRDVEPLWDQILFHYDEPYADPAAYGEYFCAQLARKYVPCALGGEGGDEFFQGFLLQALWGRDLNAFRLPWQNKSLLASRDSWFLPEVYQGYTTSDLQALLVGPHWGENPGQAQNARCLYQEAGTLAQRAGLAYVDVYHLVELIKVDRACQLAGLETRRPLQADAVVNLSFRLPSHFSIHNGERRYLYKQAFRDLLPQEIYYQRKQGFTLPVVEWLYDYRLDEVQRLFDRERIEAQGIFHYEALAPHLNAFLHGNRAGEGFWFLYAVQKWYNDVYLKL